MDKGQIKEFISEGLAKGMDLSAIQSSLVSDKGVRITFMELRLIASELENVDWSKSDKRAKESAKDISDSGAKPPSQPPLPDEDEFDDAMPDALGQGDMAPSASGTVVELSRLAKPGAIANGSVKFASGASADWVLDQYGRIGLEKASGKPTPEDVQSFQAELQRLLSNRL